MLVALALPIAGVTVTGLALAAPPAAQDLFQRAHVAYREGRFQDAVDLLLEARRLRAEPVLLYDLGRAYEALGKPVEAADAYTQFLEEAPKTPDRRSIEGRIATLRRQVAEQEALRRAAEDRNEAPAPVQAAPPLPPAAVPPAKTIVPWVLAGVGAAAEATGLVFALISRARFDDADAARSQASAVDIHDGAKRDTVIANVAFVTGGALLVTAGVWLVLRARSSHALSAVAPGGFVF